MGQSAELIPANYTLGAIAPGVKQYNASVKWLTITAGCKGLGGMATRLSALPDNFTRLEEQNSESTEDSSIIAGFATV